MNEAENQFGIFPGQPVPKVKTSDLKALWKLFGEVKARHSGTPGAVGIDYVQLVCSPGANATAVSWRTMRLATLMMRLGTEGARPPAILFSIFANMPMKWWAFGEPHHAFF